MAKRSNKTEQVLKLISKKEEEREAGTDQETKLPEAPTVDVLIKPADEKELKVETKLKIEIKPEIILKEQDLDKSPENFVRYPDDQIEENKSTLINLAERLVHEMAPEVMNKMNVCRCPVCENDVLALALNALPQMYVTTDSGKQYLQLDIYKKQHETDILTTLIRACVKVKASPRHESQ